jgi:parallel beta-helix repeat protein
MLASVTVRNASGDGDRRARVDIGRDSKRLLAAMAALCCLASCSSNTPDGQPAPSAPSNVGALPNPQPPGRSSVFINPGDSVQNSVNAHPGATTFYLRAGVHRRQTVKPKSGNAFIGEPGAVLDGDNVAPYAFETLTVPSTNVTIRGLEITRYASPYQRGALHGDNGTNWVVENNSVHDNAYIGVRAGPGWQVRGNKIYRNGVIGISGYRANGVVIEANEVYENNWSRAPEQRRRAEASGIKFLASADVSIHNNYVHHNLAKGIWLDGCNPTAIIESNTVTDNSHQGIFSEISYNVVIRNNTTERNGFNGAGSWLTGAGIQVTNSLNVEIVGNTVRNNANGITAMQSSGAALASGAHGPLRVENLHVHGNVVAMSVGKTGLAQETGERQVYTSWNNRFENNTYYLGPNRTYFAWDEKSLNETQWRTTGNDRNGRFFR